MSLEEIEKDSIIFFEEAINKWSLFLGLCVDIAKKVDSNQTNQLEKKLIEATKILVWFKGNYMRFTKNILILIWCRS